MRITTILVLALTIFPTFAAAADDLPSPGALGQPAQQSGAVVHCVVALAEQADLSPNEAGILTEIGAREGQRVDAGQVVLKLDERKAQAELAVAKAKYTAAKTKADDDVNIRYAIAADATAKKELERNKKSNDNVHGSVPMAQIEKLELQCIESTLAIEKAKHDRLVAESEAAAAEADVQAAEVMLELHKVRSPIDGIVVDLRADKGEAVSPAQPVMHVVGLNKLWVEGQVPAASFARSELENQSVTVEVVVEHGRRVSVPGKIVFVKPLTETGDSFLVRAEVQRDRPGDPWPVNPGMRADMIIPVRTAEATR